MLVAAAAVVVLQSVGGGGPTLAFGEAVERARLHHPEVRRAEATVQQVLARRVNAALVLQHAPELAVDVGHRHDSSGSHPASTGLEWTVRLSQAVDVAGQRGTRLRELSWARRAAELQLEEARLQAAANSALDFVRAQAAESLVEVARARADLAQRVLRMVHVKEHAGATGGLERTLAQVEHGDARAQLQRALAAHQAARQVLWYDLELPFDEARPLPALAPPRGAEGKADSGPVSVLEGVGGEDWPYLAERGDASGTAIEPAPAFHAGAPPPASTLGLALAAHLDVALPAAGPAEASDDCPGPACPRPQPIEALVDTGDAADVQEREAAALGASAVLRRPAGQALLAVREGLQASVQRSLREAIPSPALAFEAQKQQPGQQYFGGGITLALPVGQRGQGTRAELQAQSLRNDVERRLFAASCAKDARIAVRQLDAAARVWRTVQTEQLPAAQANVDMTVAAWRAGKLDLGHVVQSLRYLTEARQRHTDAVEALWRARIERSRVHGELP